MDEKKILVTGIGGNVGQGIIRNIRAFDSTIKIIGTNVTSFSAGNHLCDIFYKVPYAYDPTYIEAIAAIVTDQEVTLIIPATDYEVYYLSKYRDAISCAIAASSVATTEIYLDKFKTYKHLHTHTIPFAASYLPSAYKGAHTEIIVKPKMGRGSKGIVLNPQSLTSFSDEDYLVQELHHGTEITTAFYVTTTGKLHGFITFERVLENGTSIHCKVVDTYDADLKKILDALLLVSDFKGSVNLQSIVTSSGEIVPFEINCRISGTNSIRAKFGFNDVGYLIEEMVYFKPPTPPMIRKGIATRILMDVIYSEDITFEEAKDNSVSFTIS